MAGQIGWFPDGHKLAWTVHNQQGQRMDLWIVDYFSGRNEVWPGESDYQSTIAFPSWSPDAKEIAVQKYFAGELEIWRLSNFQPTIAQSLRSPL
jgi:Tol biopolymer transport system component